MLRDTFSADQTANCWIITLNIWHGTCLNRLYDKLQIIFTTYGKAGRGFEYTGVNYCKVLELVSDVYTDSILRYARAVTSYVSGIKNKRPMFALSSYYVWLWLTGFCFEVFFFLSLAKPQGLRSCGTALTRPLLFLTPVGARRRNDTEIASLLLSNRIVSPKGEEV